MHKDIFNYINHKGESVNLGATNIIIHESSLRDYEWIFTKTRNNVTSFKREIKNKSIPCIVYGPARYETANRMFEIFEKDIVANEPGTLFLGEYYIKGYFFASKKSNYANNEKINIELSFVATSKGWVKETKYIYRMNDASEDRGLGYKYDYPYDFLSSLNTQNLYNLSFIEQDMKIIIYGHIVNPALTIGGHLYAVNDEIYRNEYLTIDTKEKTVYKTTSKGELVNLFSKRNINSYIFQKIKPGENVVIPSSDEMQFDIIVLDERSEPKWT